jgi:hypothetical protein
MKHLHTLPALLFMILLTACSKKDDPITDFYVVTGTATSVYNDSSYAIILGGYNAGSKKMAFNVNWHHAGGLATGTSFRTAGGSGLLKTFGVTEPGVNGLAAGDMILTADEAALLLAGKVLYTVNTLEHPDGEIAGKVLAAPNQ